MYLNRKQVKMLNKILANTNMAGLTKQEKKAYIRFKTVIAEQSKNKEINNKKLLTYF